MQEFFKEVQSASLPGVWSKGVRLARSGAVLLEENNDDEAVFRVKSPGRPVAPVCVLYLEDFEWTCDCGGHFDPCEHVVAAAISAKEAAQSGQQVEKSEDVEPQLGYRLKRARGPSLLIERVVVSPQGEEEILSEPLARLVAHHRCPVQPSHNDLSIDSLLVKAGIGRTRASISQGLSPEGMLRLLRVLATARDVRLDGVAVDVNLDPLFPIATVEDDGDAVCLSVKSSPQFDELLDRGVVLSKGKLRPLAAVELTGPRLERLPLQRRVGQAELGTLVGEVLPSIERHVRVTIKSNRLPHRGGTAQPRLHFDMSPQGHTLSVLATLVYGNPPQVRIDGNEMVHLSGDVPGRDISAEKKLVARLREELNMIPGHCVHFDGLEAGRFAKKLRDFQESEGFSSSGEVLSDAPLVARVSVDDDRFDLRFVTDEDEEREAKIETVYRAWRDGLDMVPLQDGGWAPLPADWLSRFGHKVADILAARRQDGIVPPYAAARLAEVCKELDVPPPPSFNKLKPLLEGFDGLPQAEIPTVMPATLRAYQQHGVNFLSFLKKANLGAVLADDMGLGKTLQTLCAVGKKTLVVCPRSVVFNWAREAERFRPDLSINIYHGPKRRLDNSKLTITTYSVLRLDLPKLEAVAWDGVVLDEAQAIKSPESQVAQAAFSLSSTISESAFRLALTGTPVENRLDELWSLFRFTHPGLLGSRSDFEKRYVRPISSGQPQAVADLRQLIKPFLLRRLKRDVAADLPPRTDTILHVELTSEERELYDAIYAAKHREVLEALEAGGGVMAALEALLRLRQAACHTGLIPGQTAVSSSKVEALLDAVEDAVSDDHKCIVFSQWTSFLDLVEPELSSRGISFVRLDGTTRDRKAVVEQFQDEQGPPLILSSLKAGGTGLNLTAADHVFLLDPWWNPAAEDQAADRAHRIGQTRPVTVYRLIARDTIEEGIVKLQERKRSLADAALAEGGAAAGVTREDLLELLSER